MSEQSTSLNIQHSKNSLLRLIKHPQFTDGIKVVLIGASLETVRRTFNLFYTSFQNLFFQTIRFEYRSDMFDWVECWLNSQAKWSNSEDITAIIANYNDQLIEYSSTVGVEKWIKYRSHWFKVMKEKSTASDTESLDVSSITVSVFGFSNEPIKRMMFEGKELYETKDYYSTRVYLGDKDGRWNRLTSKSKRPWKSITLAEGIKDFLLKDVKEFFANEDWFKDRGLPFRRGILLYGIPGTGKTSTVHAIASELELPVYILLLSLKDMDDSKLADMMSGLPKRCILLLEDIDCAFKSRTAEKKDDNNTSTITLSGLLNSIDGLFAPEGRLLFATTNHIEHLDPALIRPGRIDVKIEYKELEYSQTCDMFKTFYPDNIADADIFAGKISKYSVTPSQLQAYFLLNRANVDDAIRGVDEWISNQQLKLKS